MVVMIEMRSYVLNLVPVKRRAKATYQAGRVMMYTPAETQREEKLVAAAYDGPCYDGPVRLEVHVYRALPQSRPKRITTEPDTIKPDIDNVIKAVMDGLNGVAYHDDAQVVDVRAIKHDRTRKQGDSIRFLVEPA